MSSPFDDGPFGHPPAEQIFDARDVYGVGHDAHRSARRPIRLGVIGVGGVAQAKYLPAIARLRTLWEPVRITAWAEPRADHAGKITELYGGTWYPDHERLLADEELDGVLVLSPDVCHADHAGACIEAGVPVLIEKPITRSLTDASNLCRLASEHGVLLMSVANKRCSPPYRRAKAIIDAGLLGPLAVLSGKFTLGYDYVDLLEDGTIHLCDLARFFGGDVASISAVGGDRHRLNRSRYPVDHAVISLVFSEGAVGSLITTSSALSLKPWERIEAFGRKAWLGVEDQWELTYHDDEQGPTKSWRPAPPNTLLLDEEWGGYVGVVENFIQVIRGIGEPVATGLDGLRALELTVATHLSIAGAGTLDLPLDPETADADLQGILSARERLR